MKAERQENGTWIASGNGELRPILAEGETREAAVSAYTAIYGDQYAEAQSLTHYSLMAQGAL